MLGSCGGHRAADALSANSGRAFGTGGWNLWRCSFVYALTGKGLFTKGGILRVKLESSLRVQLPLHL
jgi:hypothetical protein